MPDFGIGQILIIVLIVVGYFVIKSGKGKWHL